MTKIMRTITSIERVILLRILFALKPYSKELHVDDLLGKERDQEIHRKKQINQEPETHVEVGVLIDQEVGLEGHLQKSEEEDQRHVYDEPNETGLQEQVPNALLRNELVEEEFSVPG